jgi:PLD-like domain/GAG-polyprotein viral zinc-finger
MTSTLKPTAPEFLNTHRTQDALRDLVDSAQHTLVLTTAFVDFGKLANFWRDVGRASDRGVEVTLYARDDESVIRNALEAREVLATSRIRAFRVPNLHAKVFFNENTVVFGSINLVAASFAQSIDFAVRVPQSHALFHSARQFIDTEVRPFAKPLLDSGDFHDSKARAEKERRPRADGDACFRCGRSGHWEEDCYATTDVDGRRLRD